MAMACKGMAKVSEECCELGQVAAKAWQAGGVDVPHWSGDLRAMAEDEMADVLAAVEYATVRNGFDRAKIAARMAWKLGLFEQWEQEP